MRPTIQLSRHFTGINNGNSSQICSCKECLGPNSSCVGSPQDHQGLSSCQLSPSQKPYLLPYCQQLRPDHLRSMFPEVKTCRVTQFDSCLFVSLAYPLRHRIIGVTTFQDFFSSQCISFLLTSGTVLPSKLDKKLVLPSSFWTGTPFVYPYCPIPTQKSIERPVHCSEKYLMRHWLTLSAKATGWLLSKLNRKRPQCPFAT